MKAFSLMLEERIQIVRLTTLYQILFIVDLFFSTQ